MQLFGIAKMKIKQKHNPQRMHSFFFNLNSKTQFSFIYFKVLIHIILKEIKKNFTLKFQKPVLITLQQMVDNLFLCCIK